MCVYAIYIHIYIYTSYDVFSFPCFTCFFQWKTCCNCPLLSFPDSWNLRWLHWKVVMHASQRCCRCCPRIRGRLAISWGQPKKWGNPPWICSEREAIVFHICLYAYQKVITFTMVICSGWVIILLMVCSLSILPWNQPRPRVVYFLSRPGCHSPLETDNIKKPLGFKVIYIDAHWYTEINWVGARSGRAVVPPARRFPYPRAGCGVRVTSLTTATWHPALVAASCKVKALKVFWSSSIQQKFWK